MREFEGFLKSHKLTQGKSFIELDEWEVRDLETFETLTIKQIKLSNDPNQLRNPSKVWVGYEDVLGVGKEEWFMEFLEEEEEEVEEVTIVKTRVSLSERKGFMIKSLLEERDEKEKIKKGD